MARETGGAAGQGMMDRPARSAAGPPFLFVVVVVLAILLLIDLPRLQGEWRFFQPGTLYDAAGGASVPQDDARTSDLDAALHRAALLLPAQAVCVIAHSSWNRDYFRASYLLMPRRVWPADALLDGSLLTPHLVLMALQAHHAGCLLLPPGVSPPSGMRRLTGGDIELYMFTGSHVQAQG